jgi:hypothetical protein
MCDRLQTARVLITVMTYPHPSRNYREVVCTAGITEALEWVRLYPINYRYRPSEQKFRKYQWVELDLLPYGHRNDPRKESRRPLLESIRLVGEALPSHEGWHVRRLVVDQMPHRTLGELEALYESDRTSLGIVRPTEILDLEVTPAPEPDWKPQWKALWAQIPLFGEQPKPLRKLPYEFRYVFRCEDEHQPRKAMAIDWELGALFLKESARLGSDSAAADSVKRKYLDDMCGSDHDTRFFVGTALPYNTWLVLGVFWPPKERAHQRALPF